jgi:pimeloyl-ACP methyl ester carboxylesterase
LREERVRDVDGVAVREWGGPDGPIAVFWHGLGPLASGALGRELAPALVGRGWRLLAPDAPGFGRSSPREPAAYGLDVLGDLLVGLFGEPVALIGHSWGASLAVNAAARRPELVTALVLLDAGHRDSSDRPGFDPDATLEELAEQVRAGLVPVADDDALLALLRHEFRREPTEALIGAVREACEQKENGIRPISTPEVLAAGRLGVDHGARMSSLWPRLAESGIPVLLVTATEPPEERAANDDAAARLLAAIPKAEWLPLEGAGHHLIADRGPELGELVADWLAARAA